MNTIKLSVRTLKDFYTDFQSNGNSYKKRKKIKNRKKRKKRKREKEKKNK